MSDTSSTNEHHHLLCEEFEAEWVSGHGPCIEAYLDRVEAPQREALLVELLQIELWWRRGESPPFAADEMAQRFGNFADAVDLAYRRFEASNDLVMQTVEASAVDRSGTQKVTRRQASGDPTSVGPYKILQAIGQGGMGQVYLAEQRTPVHRRVALKIIKAGMDTTQVIARFEAERQALAMMDHAHIAKVFDAGTTATGRPFFVMELVNGTPITKFCDDHKLGIRERLDLFSQVCSAVQHAHQKGIIHRDLKPSNILVTLQDDKPIPKVIDFGLAKATNQRLTEKTMFTEHGQVLGTLEYMSPEQARLNDLDVDTRSDIYSLGVILYELLTGSTPLKRESLRMAGFVEILERIKQEEPERPSSRISESVETLESISSVRQVEPRRFSVLMKGDLDWIVIKAIEKDRARRYETANSFAADIRRYLSDEPIEARPPSASYRLKKLIQRNRVAVGFASTVALLLLMGIGVSSYLAIWATHEADAARVASQRADGERDNAIQAQAATERQRALAVSSAEEAKQQRAEALRRVYTADIQRASFELEHGNLYDAQLALERHHVEPNGEDMRGWEWYYLRARCGRESMTLREHSSIVDAIAWHPSRDLLASLSSVSGRLLVYDVGQTIIQQDLKVEDLAVSTKLQIPLLQWSVDGDSLMALFTSKSGALRCAVWDVETGNVLLSISENILYATWSPLESKLAMLFRDGTLKTWSAGETEPGVSGRLAKEMPEENFNARMSWSPDGQHIGVEHSKQTEIISVGSGQSVRQISRDSMPSRNPDANLSSLGIAWSPDSSHLVTVGSPMHLEVVDLNNPDERKLVTLPLANHKIGTNPWLSWSPHGDRLALSTSNSLVIVNDIVKQPRPYPSVYSTEGFISGIAWHNDGLHLHTFDDAGRMEVWNSSSGSKVDRFGAHTSRIFAAAWNHDRTRLATSGGDAAIRIWRPQGLVAPELVSGYGTLEWHPSKKRIYHGSLSSPSKYNLSLFDLDETKTTGWIIGDPQPDGPQPFVKAWIQWHRAEGRGDCFIRELKWNTATEEVMVMGSLGRKSKRVDGKFIETAPGQYFVLRWSPQTNARRLVYLRSKSTRLTLSQNGSFVEYSQNTLIRYNADGKEDCRCSFNRGEHLDRRFLRWQTTDDCKTAIFSSSSDKEWSLSGLKLSVVNIETAETWTRTLPHGNTKFAVSPDSRLLAYDQVDEAEGVVRLVLCSFSDGRIIHEVSAHSVPPTAVNRAPEGVGLLTFGNDRLVSGLGQEIKVWDTTNLQETLRIRLRTSVDVRFGKFSPDQKILAVQVGKNIVLLDAEPGYRMSEPLEDAYFIRKTPFTSVGGIF